MRLIDADSIKWDKCEDANGNAVYVLDKRDIDKEPTVFDVNDIIRKLNKTKIAEYRYEHNDGDQIWEDITIFYVKDDGTYEKQYYEGYNGKEYCSEISYDDIEKEMKDTKKKIERQRKNIDLYGTGHPCSRGGYSITIELNPQEYYIALINSSLECLLKLEKAISNDYYNGWFDSVEIITDVVTLMINDLKKLRDNYSRKCRQ